MGFGSGACRNLEAAIIFLAGSQKSSTYPGGEARAVRGGEEEAARRRRGDMGRVGWDGGGQAARQAARALEPGWGHTLLRPSGAATLTGLMSNMMHTASMVSLTPAGGDFMLFTSVMSSRLSVLSAFTAASSAGSASASPASQSILIACAS